MEEVAPEYDVVVLGTGIDLPLICHYSQLTHPLIQALQNVSSQGPYTKPIS
jgi:hypothetical protein